MQRMEEKVSSLRDENQNLKDALQGKNIDSSRDLALKDQKILFLEHKLTDSQAMAAMRQRELEDQLASVKADRSQQLAEMSS